MIVVTGCKRSGTSMWMQILEAAGFPPIGHAFPRDWGETSLREANPAGFYESLFRNGIHHGTNPIPGTPHYVPSAGTERHAVKIFAPGFVRTHRAFVGRVVVTMRPWRAYVRSRERLLALDEAARHERGRAERPKPARRPIDPALEWWMENVMVLRDVLMRRFEARWVAYEALLADPPRHLAPVLEWLGGEVAPALAIVRRELRTQPDEAIAHDVPPGFAEAADTWHDAVARGEGFRQAVVREVLARHDALRPALRARLERGARA